MDLKAVKRLITEGEGFELEFKRKVSSPVKIAKTLSSFANTRGGTVLFGVDDDGSIVGVESEKAELDLIRESAEILCEPPVPYAIRIVPFNRRDVIVVEVEESSEKPHFVTDETNERHVFIRVNDNTVIASKEVVKVLRDERPEKEPLTLMIGENEKRLFSYLDAHPRITVAEFASLINVSTRRASRTLTTLVRAGVIRIHTHERTDFFTLASDDEVSAGSHTARSRTPLRR
ncbi:MAG: putative DNA binding domain-containing protein [Bacteroidetes bacterium]|nr:putative DNA binding domain-containing protein [Bacteroidota bacterium]